MIYIQVISFEKKLIIGNRPFVNHLSKLTSPNLLLKGKKVGSLLIREKEILCIELLEM